MPHASETALEPSSWSHPTGCDGQKPGRNQRWVKPVVKTNRRQAALLRGTLETYSRQGFKVLLCYPLQIIFYLFFEKLHLCVHCILIIYIPTTPQFSWKSPIYLPANFMPSFCLYYCFNQLIPVSADYMHFPPKKRDSSSSSKCWADQIAQLTKGLDSTSVKLK